MANSGSSENVVLVTSQDQLDTFCEACREQGQFAFDTEFVMEDRFEAELCLIQLAHAKSVAIVDPFLELDLAEVWGLVCDEAVVTVTHAGQEDLGIALQRCGETPRNVYDVQIAAGFSGYDYPLSLQKLARVTLNVRLHKSKTLTDWRRRPLSEAQFHYAAEDVNHLLEIRKKLDRRLGEWDRLGWVCEEFSRFEDITLYRRAEKEKLARIKGSGSLVGRQRLVLKELLAWRESMAAQLNRPQRAVLKDHLLIEVARHELCSPTEVRDLRGLNLGDKHVRLLCDVVKQALATPKEQWPTQPPQVFESPEESALIPFVTGVIRAVGLEKKIAYGLLASKKSIGDLVRHVVRKDLQDNGEVALLSGWRRQAIGEELTEILSGRRSVRVDGTGLRPLLEITEIS